jgi:hypothetical protein
VSIMAMAKRPRTKKTPAAAEAKKSPAKAEASVSKQVAAVTTRTVDIQEAVRLRAYELFLQRGCQHGADFDDWLQAEQEILQRFTAAA